MEREVYSFPKNAREQVKASITEYRGGQFLSLRIWAKPKGTSEIRPTKKGLTVALALLPALEDALAAARRATEKTTGRPLPS